MRRRPRRKPTRPNQSAWQRLVAQVLAEEPDCWICELPIDPGIKWPHPMSGTGDHIIPHALGGPDERWNIRAAHKLCNEQRWNAERNGDVIFRKRGRFQLCPVIAVVSLRGTEQVAAVKMPKRPKRPKVQIPSGPRTHCRNGHELTPENTYRYDYTDRGGQKVVLCRQCAKDRYQAKKAASESSTPCPI